VLCVANRLESIKYPLIAKRMATYGQKGVSPASSGTKKRWVNAWVVFSLLLSLVPGAVLLRVNLNHGRATTLFSRTQRPPCTWFIHYIDMMSLTGAPYMPAAEFIAALAQWHKYGTQRMSSLLGISYYELRWDWIIWSRRYFATHITADFCPLVFSCAHGIHFAHREASN